MAKKGLILPFILIAAAVLAGIILFTFKTNTGKVYKLKSPSVNKTYRNNDLGFQFKYPSFFIVTQVSEQDYFTLSKTDHRKNFTGYVGYPPPEFVFGLKAGPEIGSQYEQTPLVLYVFSNPDNLTADTWFGKYWYYPFLWGIFVSGEKNKIAPLVEATISGRLAKSGVISYQPGKPEFIYLAKDGKMFMFKIVLGEDGEAISQILSSFKLD